MADYILPIFVLISFVVGALKRVPIFNCFVEGAKEAWELIKNIFPYIMTVMIAVALFKASGVSAILAKWLAPIFRAVGVPSELVELIIVRPMSGSGSFALLESVYKTYGADSYVARCASVMAGSSETVFYVTALYTSQSKVKKVGRALGISLFATIAGTIISCALCSIM